MVIRILFLLMIYLEPRNWQSRFLILFLKKISSTWRGNNRSKFFRKLVMKYLRNQFFKVFLIRRVGLKNVILNLSYKIKKGFPLSSLRLLRYEFHIDPFCFPTHRYILFSSENADRYFTTIHKCTIAIMNWRVGSLSHQNNIYVDAVYQERRYFRYFRCS